MLLPSQSPVQLVSSTLGSTRARVKKRDTLSKSSGRNTRSIFTTALITICLLATILPSTVQGFVSPGIKSDPSTVQTKADIEFWGTPEFTIFKNGFLKLKAPDQVRVFPNADKCFDIINGIDCEVVVDGKTFIIQTKIELESARQFQFLISDAITNPDSTQPTDSFEVLTSRGEIATNEIILTATVGQFEEASLEPMSKIVGESTVLQVRFKTEHTIPAGGFVFVGFPKWNPENPIKSQQKTYIQGSESCVPIFTLSERLTCDFKDDYLIVSDAAPVKINGGVQNGFDISGFKNPIQTGYTHGFTIYTAMQSKDQQFYKIDEFQVSLEITEFSNLSQGKLTVRDLNDPLAGMVQEVNDMQLNFYLPVPLNQGCKVTVELPVQYSIETVTSVNSLMVFGRYVKYTVEDGTLLILKDKNQFIIEACATYIENDKIGTIYISQLRQWKFEKATDSVKIYITSGSDDKIAQIESGVTFTPFRGEIQAKATAVNEVVQAQTDIKFEIQPEHKIYKSDMPTMVVEFPPEVQISSPQCEVTGVYMTSTSGSLSPTCSRFQQSLTVKNFLPDDYFPEENRIIYFTLGKVTNPESTYAVDGLKITIYAEGKYAIDEFEDVINWKLVTGTFLNVMVRPQSLIAYRAENTYTIYFTPQHEIPQNGYVEIQFPNEVSVPDMSYTQSSCVGVTGTGFPTTQITCEFIAEIRDDQEGEKENTHYTLRILNAFRRVAGPAGVEYVFTLPGIRNPIRTETTPSFKFSTFTRMGRHIDELNDGASVTMISSAELATVQVSLSSYTNSVKTKYTFTLVPSVPIQKENFILFTFPDEITLPEDVKELGCYSTFINLIDRVHCFFDEQYENTVRAELELDPEITQINELDRFSIEINNIGNPSSTQTTSSIEIRVVDDNYVAINSMLSNILVTTNNAFTVSKAKVIPSSPKPGIDTTFLLEFVPEHNISPGGGILVVYPPQTTPSLTKDIFALVKVDGIEVSPNGLNIQADVSARTILVENVIQDEDFIADGVKAIKVELYGLRNPFTNATTDSFQMSTFNYVSGRFYYFIDKVEEGLAINSKCSYPCQTCPDGEPEMCLSCYQSMDTESGLPYLQLGTCVAECATSRFYNLETEHCDECNPTCLDCEGTADTCTVCGVADYLYLHDEQCRQDCPVGFLKDSGENLCVPCKDSCLSCENTISTCTACDTFGQYRYFFHDDCIEECVPEISVLVDDQCIECDSTCKTCAELTDMCMTCESHMRFDPKRFTCTQACEYETQIYVAESQTCDYCHENCEKCAGSTTDCTSCKPNYLLNLDLSCEATCSADNQTPIDGVCKECEEPCATCSGTTNKCTSCLNDYLLFQGSNCVQYCPQKYTPSVDGTMCVYEGLVCPEGFSVNKAADGCIPTQFDCLTGYEINDKRTACVPSPGSPIPFPFILASIFLSFLVLGSYLKDKFFTKVLTNLISLIGSFEILMYLLMVGYSISMGEWAIFFFSLVGFIACVASNIMFVHYYRTTVLPKDNVYTRWLHFFPKTKTFMPISCLLINFKCVKMIYGGFYGLENTLAKFGQHKTFFRIMRMTTYFSFVFQYGFIYIADIIIFARVKWGYQLLILGIETFILQTLLIILTYFEFKEGSQKLLAAGGESYTMITATPRKGGNVAQLKVMGAMEDSDYEEGIPDMDEDTLIRSKYKTEEQEINLRKIAFSKILNQVGQNLENAAKKGVDIGGDLDQCMSKFDKAQLRYRRAFSLSNVGEEDSWIADGESVSASESRERDDQFNGFDNYGNELEGEGKGLQRRYSFPLSPKTFANIPNTNMFEKQIKDIKKAAEDFLYDNVYAEPKRPEVNKSAKKKKTVSRRTQTYLRELLQIEGEELQESDMEILMEDEAEIDQDYAQGLINNVIDGISDGESAGLGKKGRGKKPKKRPFRAKKEIPDFELADIMGEFEIDDLGNFIIMRGARGELLDKKERKVNRRGYLVDRFGNVINTQGNVIFKAVELDVDDEIPAPFGFEKRKKNLLKLGEENQFKIENNSTAQGGSDTNMNSALNKTDNNDEDLIDKELQDIRNQNKRRGDSPTSSMDEMANINADNVDQIIDKVTQRKMPRKRDTLKRRKGNKGMNNPPPKRIKQEDTKDLFPIIGIENDEQRRLVKIANSISGLAGQLASEARLNPNLSRDQYAGMGTHQHPQTEFFGAGSLAPEGERLNQLKQEHLRDIIADSEIGVHEPMHSDHANFMLQDRPSSHIGAQPFHSISPMGVIGGTPGGGFGDRAGTAPGGVRRHGNRNSGGKLRDKRGNIIAANRTGGNNLQKVYGNIVDLVGFEEQHLMDMMQPRKGHMSPSSRGTGQKQRRGQSGHTGDRHLRGLESVYMKKFHKKTFGANASQNISQQRLNLTGSRKSDHNPFRPTMHQFVDDPGELNVDTEMDGTRIGGSGKDMSMVIADRLDSLQKQYLTKVQHQNQSAIGNKNLNHSDLRHQHSEYVINTTQQVLHHGGSEPRTHGLNSDVANSMTHLAHENVNVHDFQGTAQPAGHLDPVKQGNWVDRNGKQEFHDEV